MFRKPSILLLFSGFLFLLAVGLAFSGWQGCRRRLEIMSLKNFYDVGRQAMKNRQFRRAESDFRFAVKAWERAQKISGPEILPGSRIEIDGCLLAGHCYRLLRRLRQAQKCYTRGLQYAPNSISLLTAYGGCAYNLGDYSAALESLEKSNRIYPLKVEMRPILETLRRWQREQRDG